MQKYFTGIILLAALAATFACPEAALARSSYLSTFGSTYPAAPAAIQNCTLCHPGNDFGSLNAYADDYRRAGRSYAAVENQDSDGDGALNIDEILAGYYPGDAASTPPPAAPTLSGVTVSGPATVNEGGMATYVATAQWSDGSSTNVNPTWSENSAFASIDNGGVLTAAEVVADQSLVVTATYASDGVSRQGTLNVTVLDVPPPAPTLSALSIEGPATVDENATASYSATATWSDGSTTVVTPDWSENSAFASIDAEGLLSAAEVTTSQGFMIHATFTDNGVTRSAGRPVTILDVSADPATDADNDGMADAWEQSYGLDPASPGDAVLDGDGDGLTNLQEYRAGTDPTTSDTDNDGVWDGSDRMPTDPTRPYLNGDGVHRYGIWQLDNGNLRWDSALDTFVREFGTPQQNPVAGDWSGDGRAKVGTFENGTWYLDLNGNGRWDGAGVDAVTLFGFAGMVPVTGDWNGDGLCELGGYENGTWYLDLNGNGQWDGAGVDRMTSFGNAGMVPVAGDWNGDGRSDLGAYENGTWYLDLNDNGQWDGAGVDRMVRFGSDAMAPVVGDWDGDGTTQVGAYENGTLYLDSDGDGQYTAGSDQAFEGLGEAGDLPLAGDWNGDGRSQFGLWK